MTPRPGHRFRALSRGTARAISLPMTNKPNTAAQAIDLSIRQGGKVVALECFDSQDEANLITESDADSLDGPTHLFQGATGSGRPWAVTMPSRPQQY